MRVWYRKSGWFIEIKYWGIDFWTPKTMYFFGWWNPFTHRILISLAKSNIPHSK